MAMPLRTSVRAGDWVAVSGQLGLDSGVLVDGFPAQAERALAAFVAELAVHGLTTADVVKTTVFFTDPARYSDLNTVYSAVFSENPPARSAVIVRALPLGAEFEIEGWAHDSAQ